MPFIPAMVGAANLSVTLVSVSSVPTTAMKPGYLPRQSVDGNGPPIDSLKRNAGREMAM